MGQIKNIKLHIVTDIKSPRWENIQQILKIQQNHAKLVVHIFEFISRTHEKQLKPSKRCTSGKPTDISKMSSRRNKSSRSEDSVEVSVVKLKPKPMVVPREDGPSSPLNSCCNF